MIETAKMTVFVHCVTDPVFAVCRGCLYLGFTFESCRYGFRNGNIARGVDGYLTTVHTVIDKQESLVGDAARFGHVIKRFGKRAVLVGFARSEIDDDRRIEPRVIRRDGRDNSSDIISARRYDGTLLECIQFSKTGEQVVCGELRDEYLLRGLTRGNGDAGLPFGSGGVVLDGDCQALPVLSLFGRYPGGVRGSAPCGGSCDDGDRQGLVVLALEGTCHLTEVDVMELFLVFGTSCQCRGSQKGGEAFVQIVFVHGWMVC